eukprot:SAG31_NODE_539_length_14296_cov_14.408819_11_plen_87_part_00
MLPAYERVPDWRAETITVPSMEGLDGSSMHSGDVAASNSLGAAISDVAVLRRVVPELEEGQARRLLTMHGCDLKKAMAAALSSAKL